MNRRLISVFFIAIPLFGLELKAQNWSNFRQISGPGSETIDRMAIAPDGAVCVAGVFDQNFTLGTESFSSTGNNDVFFGCFGPAGDLRWARSGGSILNDEIAALTTDGTGNVFAAGTFWFDAQFDSISLSANWNPKGIFLLKFSSEGNAIWGLSVNGSGLKGVGGIAADQSGNVWLSGFFGGQLSIGDTILNAAGASDLFLAKFSANGQMLWALREGEQGDTRVTALTVNRQSGVVAGGFFNKQTHIGGLSFTANTSDRDIFLAAYDAQGQSLWARKAGGVHDDDLSELDTDDEGNIYAAGYFVGVINLGEGISIQSATGNPDFFILKYDSNGTPLRARALGGPLSQLATSLTVKGGRVALCGHFQGAMSWDGFSLHSGGPFAAFFASFNTQLEGLWAQALTTTQGVFPQQIRTAGDGSLWSAGSFSGYGLFPTGETSAWGLFDGFLLSTSAPVGILPAYPTMPWMVFPNPTQGQISVMGLNSSHKVMIADAAGRIYSVTPNADRLNLSFLPDGYYFLIIIGNGIRTTIPVIKKGS